jgi:hypothetical protein
MHRLEAENRGLCGRQAKFDFNLKFQISSLELFWYRRGLDAHYLGQAMEVWFENYRREGAAVCEVYTGWNYMGYLFWDVVNLLRTGADGPIRRNRGGAYR